MWAFSIDDRTLLCLALNVTKHGISNFGRNNFKLVKQVLTLRILFFQCSLSQGYATLNRGSSGLWVYGSVLFHHTVSGGRGMTFFRPCTRVKVRVTLDASVQLWCIFLLRSQPGAYNLCMSLQQSSFSLLLQWSSHQSWHAPVPQRCLNAWIWISANRHLFWPAVLRDM